MPEASVLRPAIMRHPERLAFPRPTATPRGVNAAVAGDTPDQRPVPTLTNGRGRVPAAFGGCETLCGGRSEPLKTCKAEGGPAVLICDVVVREDVRGQGRAVGPMAGSAATRRHATTYLGEDQ